MEKIDVKIFDSILPLKNSPLIHCITNDITIETVANSILYIGGKPIMSEDSREFRSLFQTTDALFLNMGRMSETHEKNLKLASQLAYQTKKPMVVDMVGYGITQQRLDLGNEIINTHPAIIKGNSSEMRRIVGLPTSARGIDRSEQDNQDNTVFELLHALKVVAKHQPETVFVATGPIDIVVKGNQCVRLNNGVSLLDRFVGTGDIVGALMATLLGAGYDAWTSSLFSLSYLNIAGEQAFSKAKGHGIENFRQTFMNELSVLSSHKDWVNDIRPVSS
ncbi:hydroxyethylthiazole kinase [Leuconostoc falkenbergense]|uniref:hydroxyethylthiazole kinase n=1 Tax=Leuconostoc falkenbergense TaxID=2766470 RepID=UPI0024AE08BF|nr:hydroxyethylthiazole kinase [Leuconostoc falkenbergense]MDI6666758.1 hydroxyethylthiazole kinase [Leuconostoc falkenbergense]